MNIEDESLIYNRCHCRALKRLCNHCLQQKTPEMITTAALLVDGVIWTLPRPARHHVLIHAYALAHHGQAGVAGIRLNMQGFMTSRGRWVSREEALGLARVAGQLRQSQELSPGRLTTEDLW